MPTGSAGKLSWLRRLLGSGHATQTADGGTGEESEQPALDPAFTRPAHWEDVLTTTRLLNAADDWDAQRVPAYVEREFRRYLECSILAYGFARARCPDCGHDFLVAFSCKGRGLCPSCNARRMAETAAHLIDHVFPPLPVRQWFF